MNDEVEKLELKDLEKRIRELSKDKLIWLAVFVDGENVEIRLEEVE